MKKNVRLKSTNKFGAVKKTLVFDGKEITFASSGEYLRAMYLLSMQQDDKISDLIFHPEFVLIAGFRINSLSIQGAKYTADFKYLQDGETIVEDFKSPATAKKADYVLRKKLFLFKYGDYIKFKEVFFKKGGFTEKNYY